MSENDLPEDVPGDPGEDPGAADDDILRHAAREIRAAKSLQALVPLSASDREFGLRGKFVTTRSWRATDESIWRDFR